MNTCKNCKWWGQSLASACGAPQSALVRRAVSGPSSYEETTTEERNGFVIDARADDDSGLDAYLVTGPDFGCVRFAQKCPTCEGFGMTRDAQGRYDATCAACAGTGSASPSTLSTL